MPIKARILRFATEISVQKHVQDHFMSPNYTFDVGYLRTKLVEMLRR
jgi:hypothetical protein